MGILPQARVTEATLFAAPGIDYAGPFLIKTPTECGSKVSKVYNCLFICLAVKAINLELVIDLSTETFIAALRCSRRFWSYRGVRRHVWSDNAGNFVGVFKTINEFTVFFSNLKDEIIKSCIDLNLSWHFSPPTPPHGGGLWESGIKNVKKHLFKVVVESKRNP